ncbi:hypothetical protein PC123_g26436 [Phytophthora cactorum]|nr:hypothetical protein PC120_g25834 [Phytophthora cactorum]KAG4038000.1 hypothetical protein PC123_g26436 [Phytophthora cactorum]
MSGRAHSEIHPEASKWSDAQNSLELAYEASGRGPRRGLRPSLVTAQSGRMGVEEAADETLKRLEILRATR